MTIKTSTKQTISRLPYHSSSLSEKEVEIEEGKGDINILTYVCENTDGILDPIDQMTFALNETAIRYGPVIVLKDAP